MSTRISSTSEKNNTELLNTSFAESSDTTALIDRHLLLAIRSLHSCSDICKRVVEVKSRPFTVSVRLLHHLHEWSRQPQWIQRMCHCWKLRDQPFAVCGEFGAACIL